MRGILSGLRVVEVSAYVAAPFAGATLASMGADVIRVEQLGGGIDAMRWPIHRGRSLYRAGLDQGKRSVSLDMRSPRGQQLVAALIAAGDDSGGILITNLGARGWMAYERLTEQRPDLIMVSILGTPEGGSAVDYTVNAGIGFPLVTGPSDLEGPVNHVLPAWDITTGALAATAILAAERHRRSTGAGQLVQIALSDVALSVAGHLGYLTEANVEPEPRGRFGNDVFGSYGRDFRTRDGRYVMICALTPRHWASLVEATGLTEQIATLEGQLGADLRDEGQRFQHRAEISVLIQPWVAARTMAEVGQRFEAHGVLWGPYRSFKQLLEEQPEAAHPFANPMQFGGFQRAQAPAAPSIGADTEDVLQSELGINSVGLAELREHGIIQ